jgi:hypothetical protein
MHYTDLADLAGRLESKLQSDVSPPTDQIDGLLARCDQFADGLDRLKVEASGPEEEGL